jgi:hypothetical protein
MTQYSFNFVIIIVPEKFMRKLVFALIIIFNSFTAFPQGKVDFKDIEDSLSLLGLIIRDGHTDFIKYNANERFTTLLESALIADKSFDYPFDSLVTIARLTSDDKKFRIFNWHIAKSDGTYEYFGFIQAWNRKEKKYIIYPLKDNSDNIKNPETQLLDNLNWYGAHYYKLISTKYHGRRFYTLLGWDGNNGVTQKKLIDVLTFNSKGKPIFGASIFKYNKKTLKRIIFEYNATVTMSLKYDKQYSAAGKKKKNMIVFDRISPLDKSMEGQYQYYYPETNIFDALLFHAGKWNHIKDIDARNAKETKEEKKHRKEIIREQKEHSRP